MHNSDIIEVLADNAPQDGVQRPGMLAPGYYLALPRRSKNKRQRNNPHYVAPTLVGPIHSEAAARLLKVSSAYLGLNTAEPAPRADIQERHPSRKHHGSRFRPREVVYARVL